MTKIFPIIFFFFLLSISHAQTTDLELDQIASLRMLGHNNLPVKVLVDDYDGDFVREMVKIVGEINVQDELKGTRHQIKVVIVGGYIPEPPKGNDYQSWDVGSDLWLQDWGEMMVATQVGDDKERLLVFDTNRGRGLAELPRFLAKVLNAKYHHKLSTKNGSGNYGGNLEVTPNNVLWIGNTTNQELRNFLIGKGYPEHHVVLDTNWLAVGHVDEYISQVVLDESDPCGFALVKADVGMGLKLLKESSLMDITQMPYSSDNDIQMVERLSAMRRYLNGTDTDKYSKIMIDQNERIDEIIDDNIEKLQEAITYKSPQCEDIKVISFPTVFKCKDYKLADCSALLPGSINMLVLRNHQIIADPFFAPYSNYINQTLKEHGQIPHFVDDRTYHYRLGQVHCGTNVLRLPNEYYNNSIGNR